MLTLTTARRTTNAATPITLPRPAEQVSSANLSPRPNFLMCLLRALATAAV